MSTNTPSIGCHILTTVKVFAIAAGIAAGFSIGNQADMGSDTPAAPVPTVQEVAQPQEDDPDFDCRVHGNDVCGPTGEHQAGCYNAGDLVMPWSEELRGQTDSPCTHITGTYEVPGGWLTVYEDTSARYDPAA